MTPVIITCLNIHCPERFSICCGARSRLESNMTKEPFVCSDCGQKFVGGKCNAMEDKKWKREFRKKFTDEICGVLKNKPLSETIQRNYVDCTKELEDFIQKWKKIWENVSVFDVKPISCLSIKEIEDNISWAGREINEWKALIKDLEEELKKRKVGN